MVPHGSGAGGGLRSPLLRPGTGKGGNHEMAGLRSAALRSDDAPARHRLRRSHGEGRADRLHIRPRRNSEIYVVNADGTGLTNLTNNQLTTPHRLVA